MPKGSPSLDVGGYRPISITPVLSKVFQNIFPVKLSHYLESNSLLTPKFSYRRGLGTCDSLLTLSHHLQAAWTGARREGLYSWTSQQHLIGLVTVICCISCCLEVLEGSSCS